MYKILRFSYLLFLPSSAKHLCLTAASSLQPCPQPLGGPKAKPLKQKEVERRAIRETQQCIKLDLPSKSQKQRGKNA
jgi:hypothetical protein